MRVPIACTLRPDAVKPRLDEWRQVLAASVMSVERVAAGHLRLEVCSDPALLASLVVLAQQEKACCAFFDFTMEIGGEVTMLTITVPKGNEAAGILDDFATLAPARPRSVRSD